MVKKFDKNAKTSEPIPILLLQNCSTAPEKALVNGVKHAIIILKSQEMDSEEYISFFNTRNNIIRRTT